MVYMVAEQMSYSWVALIVKYILHGIWLKDMVMHRVVNEWAILTKQVEVEVSAPLLRLKKVAMHACEKVVRNELKMG